jgi:hypothetical protein
VARIDEFASFRFARNKDVKIVVKVYRAAELKTGDFLPRFYRGMIHVDLTIPA